MRTTIGIFLRFKNQAHPLEKEALVNTIPHTNSLHAYVESCQNAEILKR